MSELTIGIDARAAAEVPAGRGRYVRELLRGLARLGADNRYVLYTRRRWDEALDERFDWRERALPDAPWHVVTARAASRECDVFLATNSYVTPWFLTVPTAVVVHDLIPFREGTHANRRAAQIERLTLRRAVRRAALILCDSEATRRDLLELRPELEPKAVAVPLAASEEFRRPRDPSELERVQARHGLDRPFVLCAGTLEPRKNLERVFEAYARLPERLRDSYPLVVVGPRGWEYDQILRRAADLGERVKLLGHVPDEDLAALYQSCAVFCFPSLYEGFGLPLLEAMTAGAAAITSNVSSLPEVGGDGARYVDPTSVAELAAALEGLLDSPEQRQALGAQARRQAATFSWDRTAERTLELLTRLR